MSKKLEKKALRQELPLIMSFHHYTRQRRMKNKTLAWIGLGWAECFFLCWCRLSHLRFRRPHEKRNVAMFIVIQQRSHLLDEHIVRTQTVRVHLLTEDATTPSRDSMRTTRKSAVRRLPRHTRRGRARPKQKRRTKGKASRTNDWGVSLKVPGTRPYDMYHEPHNSVSKQEDRFHIKID